LLSAAAVSGRAAAAESGWAVTCSDAKSKQARVVTHAEEAAFVLASGETLDPQVGADGMYARFESDVRIVRPGRYRFAIDVAGGAATLALLDEKKSVLATASTAKDAQQAEVTFELKSGAVRVAVEFARAGNAAARLRTRWEMQGQNGSFVAEPIPPTVASVPKESEPDVERTFATRRGRVLLTELGCANCHAASGAAAAVVERRPPNSLERVAARARRDWLARWIADPQALNPGCGMPSLLGGAKATQDVAVLIDLLDSLAPSQAPASAPADVAVDPGVAERGRALFHEYGCVACHGPFESPQAAYAEPAFPNEMPSTPPAVPFGDLKNKWRIDELAAFLRDPKAVRTHGRMPDLALSEPDALAIAHYLATKFGRSPSGAVVPDTVDPARIEAGKSLFNRIGCAACHTLSSEILAQAPDGMKPLESLDAARGCLADPKAAAHGAAPRYALTAAQHGDLAAALASLKQMVGAPAPIERARALVATFRCLACHEKDSRGGVASELVPYFRTLAEADLGDEGRLPPRLTGAGARLQTPWIAEVVANGTRARPYVAARMPKFGEDIAHAISAGFVAGEGEWRSDSDEARAAEPKLDLALATDGRRLVGKDGLNCITCHSFGDRPSAGTPGLDFLGFSKRIRGDFWRRYALSPLRAKPGTRMPTYFEDGKSQTRDVLDGDATKQIEAIWTFFQRAHEMPAPDGVPTGQKMVLDVGDQPVVFRTFLERAGSRGIAVGTPQGLHFAFDAEQIRLVEAWTGQFLDVAPVWNGRGGNVAPELGPIVWSALPGPALLLAPPDALQSNTAIKLTAVPDLEHWPTDGGRAHGMKFGGYRLEADGTPTFLYELRDATVPFDAPPQPNSVHVEERFEPSTKAGVRFKRTFRVFGLPVDRAVMMREPRDSAAGIGSTGTMMIPTMAPEPDGSIPKIADARHGMSGVLFFRMRDAATPLVIHYEVAQ
jgi:cytochrome c2